MIDWGGHVGLKASVGNVGPGNSQTLSCDVLQVYLMSISPLSSIFSSRAVYASMTDSARLKATVYVGGLDNAVNEQILADAFLPFGEILDVTIPKSEASSSPNPHRGFGYVEFEIPADAKEAIENMDQSELFGRVIKVAAAKPQKESNEGLGSKTAIWEQVSCSIVKNLNLNTKSDDVGGLASRTSRQWGGQVASRTRQKWNAN